MRTIIKPEEEKMIVAALKLAYEKSNKAIDSIPAYKRNKVNLQGHSRNALVETELSCCFSATRRFNTTRNYEYTTFLLSCGIVFTVEHVSDIGNSPKHALYKKELGRSLNPTLFSMDEWDSMPDIPLSDYAFLIHSGKDKLESVLLRSVHGSFEPKTLYISDFEDADRKIIAKEDDQFEAVDVALEKEV
nr:hypothetical protein [uncultured Sphaerochaeta sp.]